MKFSFKIGQLEKAEVETLLVFGWENHWLDKTEALDKEMGGILKKEAERREFKAERGKILSVATQGKISAEKVILLGLGKKQEINPYHLRQAFASVVHSLREEKILSVALVSPETGLHPVEALAEGFLLGSYEFKKYKTQDKQEKKEKQEIEIVIFVKDARELVAVKEAVTRAEISSQATNFARDLVNEPASVTTPTYLAQLAERLSKTAGFSCKIYEKEEIEKLRMGCLLGVAAGSDQPPRFIKLDYRNGHKKIVLVGKGITFDTGGLSLKKEDAMETMKMDMAGAADILAIFSVIEKLRPKIHLIGLIPCTENMPSGKAMKPGDIIKAYNGKTIEVINTDAEGRLILADALSFGAELKPDLMIDLATLTGACIVALGEEVAGLFSEEEKLVSQIKQAGKEVGEKFWSMPLEKDYRELLKSEVADLKNVSGKHYGGAITAALFLQEFVSLSSWVHLDIAGPAWEEKGTNLIPKGGSGFGVRTILNFLQKM